MHRCLVRVSALVRGIPRCDGRSYRCIFFFFGCTNAVLGPSGRHCASRYTLQACVGIGRGLLVFYLMTKGRSCELLTRATGGARSAESIDILVTTPLW